MLTILTFKNNLKDIHFVFRDIKAVVIFKIIVLVALITLSHHFRKHFVADDLSTHLLEVNKNVRIS